ncbi:MAG TPA: hypothetical protein VE153_34955 [Myxococcus sp.]|nr:hypothetical protein [Myxococcus sp.]
MRKPVQEPGGVPPSNGPPRAWLRWPRSLWVALALAVVVSLPSVLVGFLLDDFVHRLVLTGELHEYGDWGPLTLYEFVGTKGTSPTALRETGLLPWWTSDDLSVRFFRPLPSALLVLDSWLFGDAPLPAHLHSLAWFLGLVAVVAWLHQRLLPAPVAAVATLAYAVAAAHLMPIAWVASRHPLISGLLGLLALAAHLRAREDGWKPGAVLAPLLLAFALLSGEPTLGVVAMMAAYELLGRREPLGRAARALAPHAVLVAVYLVFYVASGYGARGSGAYLDPRAAPGTFIVTVLVRVFILLGELVVATPSDAAAAVPPLHPAFAAWGALVTVGALLLLRTLWGGLTERERTTLRWLLPGGMAAAVPGAVGVIGGRVLVLPLVAGGALVAVLLVRGWAAAREPGRVRSLRWALRGAVALLVLGHFIFGPLFRMALGVGLAQIAQAQERIARETPDCPGTMLMVAAADPSLGFYVAVAMKLQGRTLHRFRHLSAAPHPHRLERTSATAFDLVVETDDRQPGFWELVHRPTPPPVGLSLNLEGIQVLVKESNEGGPMRVHFDFGRPLESPELCFVSWRDGALRPLTLPPPGEKLPLPHTPGPMGL